MEDEGLASSFSDGVLRIVHTDGPEKVFVLSVFDSAKEAFATRLAASAAAPHATTPAQRPGFRTILDIYSGGTYIVNRLQGKIRIWTDRRSPHA
jgi:hypothetical protein